MKIANKVYELGRFWILVGVLLFVLSQLFIIRGDFYAIIGRFCNDLGLAFIVFGIVSIILQFEDWKAYFQDRLKDIVVQRAYLESLSPEELTALQVATLKAKYKGTDIDREGSFLQYFQSKIQDYIGSPYRENVTSSFLIEEASEKTDCFLVYEDTAYTCRSLGDKIQDDARWTYEPDEFEEVVDISLILKCAHDKIDDCKNQCMSGSICENGIIKLQKDELKQYYNEDVNLKGYYVPFNDLLNPKDGLQVHLSASYLIKSNRFFMWSMTNPSKGINFIITFPHSYTLNTFIVGLGPSEYTKNINGNMQVFKHEGWFLPRTGFVFNLVKKD